MPDTHRDNPMGRRYRLVYQYRNWIGRPDPSGFGRAVVSSDDPSWLHEHSIKLQSQGHRIIHTQRWEDDRWVNI